MRTKNRKSLHSKACQGEHAMAARRGNRLESYRENVKNFPVFSNCSTRIALLLHTRAGAPCSCTRCKHGLRMVSSGHGRGPNALSPP